MDFTKAQEMLELQKKAQKIQDELSNIHIEAEVDGVVIVVDGQMKFIRSEIKDVSLLQNKEKLEKAITEASNKAMKKAQEVAAEKMRGIMGSMGLDLPMM